MAVSEPRYGVRLDKNALIPMNDGVEIAADVYRPQGEGKFPAILIYLPYRKDDYAIAGSYVDFPDYFVPRGYGVVFADIRGTGNSGGSIDEFFGFQEQRDGYEVVEWIARQPWCDGNVGMTGVSYGGFTSFLVATMKPPHLKAIIPIHGAGSKHVMIYPGGNVRSIFTGFINTFRMGIDFAPPAYRDPEGRWAKVWEEHIEKDTPLFLSVLAHQTEDFHEQECSMVLKAKNISAATYVIDGWHDIFPTEPFQMYNAMRADLPKKLLMGPWTHMRPNVGIPGPQIDYPYELLRWFDQWLKGMDTGIMKEPPITIYVRRYDKPVPKREMDSGEWRYENEFPLKRRKDTPYYLHPNGELLEEPSPSGITSERDTYEYDPTVGMASRLWNAFGWDHFLAVDQRSDENLSLTYTTKPLANDLEVTGMPVAILYVSSTTDVASFSVKLNDVTPDGTSAQVTRGILNVTRRSSLQDPKPMNPGEVYELAIGMDGASYVFERGHRIRLAVSNSDFPDKWPTGAGAMNTIYRSQKYQSRITLPIVAPQSPPLPKPAFQPGKPTTPPPTSERIISKWEGARDKVASTATVNLASRGSFKIKDGMGSTLEAGMTFTVSEKKPSDAMVKSFYYGTYFGPGDITRVEADGFVKSDEKAFHAYAMLKITVNDLPYRTKSWSTSFPRKHL